MNKNKLKYLALGLVILIALAGCTPKDTGMTGRNRNLSTQTRIGNNDLNNGWNNNDMNMGLNDGVNNGGINPNSRMNTDLNNGFDTGLNNGMARSNTGTTNNTNLSTSMGNLSGNANEIAKKISALPEVDAAHVVISNDTAVVGCNLRGTTQGTMTNALKQKIEKIVKDNTNITKVSVTSDPDLFTRIQTMSTGVGNGNTSNNLGTDIKDIIDRITNDVNNMVR